MEYVYASLILHSSGKEVTEDAVTKILEAAGSKPDSARVKALIASLKDVNIAEAIEKAAVVQTAAPVVVATGAAEAGAKKEKKAEEDSKSEEEAAEGLGSLFG